MMNTYADQQVRERGGGEERSCHCQGSRLLVLLGPVKTKTTGLGGNVKDAATGAFLVGDSTMYMAQHWALGFYAAQRARNAHIHMLAYDAPSGAVNDVHRPMVPRNTAHPAETVLIKGRPTALAQTAWSWSQEHHAALDSTLPRCCCFFTEVMLVCHGDQAGSYRFIMEPLQQVLAGRPVERLVLWTCESSDLFSPAASNDYYKHITWLVRPQACRCGCHVSTCNAFDPDCKARHCPDGKTATTILTSGAANGKAAKLGIDPSAAQPLTSPDGRLREITIQPDGTTAPADQVTAAMGKPGGTFFDGLSCGTDPALVPGGIGKPDPKAVKDYATKNLKPSQVERIGDKDQGYKGPESKTSHCDPALGCMTGPACSGPG